MHTCLVGLVGAGKSTALAALWFSLNAKSEACAWYLANADRPTDPRHWIDLLNNWLSGVSIDRTEHSTTPVNLSLTVTAQNDKGSKVTINAPDIGGEDFQQFYEAQQFPTKHAKIIEDADNIVLFVHVEDFSHPVKLDPPTSGKTTKTITPGVEWSPREMYQACKNIALLKGIRSLRDNADFSLTVALSAWDKIEGNTTPQKVLQQRFPLLHQYLATNFKEYDLVGLSAQGCDYDDAASVKNIDLDDIKRIKVVSSTTHNDITKLFC